MGASRQEWRTPPELFAFLSDRWGPFDLDAFASANNALLPEYNTSDEWAHQWSSCRKVFGNPPFSRANWAAALARDAWLQDRTMSILILPASVNAKWWHSVRRDGMTLFPTRRIQFLPPAGVSASTNSRDCCLLLFGYGVGEGVIDLPTGDRGEQGAR